MAHDIMVIIIYIGKLLLFQELAVHKLCTLKGYFFSESVLHKPQLTAPGETHGINKNNRSVNSK